MNAPASRPDLASTADQAELDPSSGKERSTARELPCVHCGLPTPCDGACNPKQVFCCGGCRQAYQLIHGWGLDQFYSLRDQTSGSSENLSLASLSSRNRYEVFDDDLFLGRSKPVEFGQGQLKTSLSLSGLHCAACVWLIENIAKRTDGWTSARVNMSRHTIEIIFAPQQIKLSQIADLIGQLGYTAFPLTDQPVGAFAAENRRLLMRIAVAGFLAANAMWIAIALYAGDASWVAADHRSLLRLFGTGLGLASVLGPGRVFFVGALASLRTRTPHMDLPVALGLLVGSVVGGYNAFVGVGEVYFDSLSMLVFLLLIGRWVQFRQQHRAANAIELLLRITPQHARRIESQQPGDGSAASEPNDPAQASGDGRMVTVDSLQTGQAVRVLVGESIPVDGSVLAGQSMVDRSLLTGESVPVAVGAGDEVTAGTVNLTSPIDVQVSAVGMESRIGQVMQTVERALGKRTPIVQLADRIGGVFVVAVTSLAVVTFAYWLRSGLDQATANATSLLIVACPCALALATPLAIAITLGRAAKRKVLIRDGGVLQQLSRPGVVWFDKTGTLTEGRPKAKQIAGPEEALFIATALERSCCHPIADAIIQAAQQAAATRSESQAVDSYVCQNVALAVGGVSGEVQQIDEAGDSIRCWDAKIGNQPFVSAHANPIDVPMQRAVERCVDDGATPILLAVDGQIVAVFGVADRLKRDASQTVESLRALGWQVGILSGDHPSTVQLIANQAGVPKSMAFGAMTPEEKLAVVTSASSPSDESRDDSESRLNPADLDPAIVRGTTVMIGDGANDAAALAAADVGIAVRGGAEVSLQSAPVFVASSRLHCVPELIQASKSANRLIATTFAVSLSYNMIAAGLAMSGMITPLVAAVLMPISSVSVLSLSLIWPTFGKETR